MKIGILGAGFMGKEAAMDALNSEGVEMVGLADVEMDHVYELVELAQSEKLFPFEVDATHTEELENFMQQFDVVINALFYSFNETVAKVGIDVGTHVIDLGGHIGDVKDNVLRLNDEAVEKGITIIPDLGVAPGMINILTGYGASKLEEVEMIKLYVGGIPLRPEAPLGYHHVFSMEGLLDHYTDPSTIIRNGKREDVLSLSEPEEIYFEKFGPLEAFHTSGGTSTLLDSFSDVHTLEYKTIRYPGHREKFQLFVDLQMTDRYLFVELEDDQYVKPREVLLKVLEPFVDPTDKEDVVLLKAYISGKKADVDTLLSYELITYYDKARERTAMSQVTGATVSIVAQLIASGTITERGVVPPEKIVPGKQYIAALKERGIHIKEHKMTF